MYIHTYEGDVRFINIQTFKNMITMDLRNNGDYSNMLT